MKNRSIIAIVLALVLALGCIVAAQAEIIKPQGPGQIGYDAVVLCEELTVRQSASSSAKAVKTLKYGAHMTVFKQTDGWAQIFLSDAIDAEPAGWVNAEYIVVDPAWYKTEKKTAVYAWNSTSAPKVALLSKGETLPILKQDGDWMIVSLRGAVGFIHK